MFFNQMHDVFLIGGLKKAMIISKIKTKGACKLQ